MEAELKRTNSGNGQNQDKIASNIAHETSCFRRLLVVVGHLGRQGRGNFGGLEGWKQG